MSINPKSVEFHQCHAIPHSICFLVKDNERNLCQNLLTIENTDSDLKVHALHYANELLVRVRLSFQKLFLVKEQLDFQLQSIKVDSQGRYILLEAMIQDSPFYF